MYKTCNRWLKWFCLGPQLAHDLWSLLIHQFVPILIQILRDRQINGADNVAGFERTDNLQFSMPVQT